mmetsp:Transcript_23539/g.73857  ORF Transcript_23539/g.73857 Transcript_23539/m.73857 type:complete len:230 (-) Transcript_23539:1202-1891(-)
MICSRSVPGGQYGRWGRKNVRPAPVGGRRMTPLPVVQSPAMARRRLDLPAPLSPTTSSDTGPTMPAMLDRSRSRPWISLRLPSGVFSVRPSIFSTVSSSTDSRMPRRSCCSACWSRGSRSSSAGLAWNATPEPSSCATLSRLLRAPRAQRSARGRSSGCFLRSATDGEGAPSTSTSLCRRSANSARRSTPAENCESASNWLMMMLKSLRMWLKAPKDWLTTPSSTDPAK